MQLSTQREYIGAKNEYAVELALFSTPTVELNHFLGRPSPLFYELLPSQQFMDCQFRSHKRFVSNNSFCRPSQAKQQSERATW